ncbi:AraC family transcriptional regulator ligand-binding domain-containing protein [Flammeovirgaceae bacterium SG7u.111]|nr:AraC family transcriptional regulator ligand-binding domain-containing protein [Flammeovirgaceae bacterium SG7u.132]WPO36241.1 AraC family transcriptional regulator ligand-binding domain-containing protein [Flammeovirgaceae bacterium SG7u.111]
MHFNGRFVLNLAQFAAQQGADLEKLIALSGKPAKELYKEDCKLSAEEYNEVLKAAVEETNDELFGLHAGESLNLSAAGLIVQIAQTSQTVKQALEYCCEFANLGCSALPTLLSEEKDYFKLSLKPNPLWEKQAPISVIHTLYGYLAFTIREFQSLTFHKQTPKEIWLTFERPTNLAELERVLGTTSLKFGQKENALILSKRQVEEKVVTSDYELLKVLVNHAHDKQEKMHLENGFYEVVRRSVVNLIKPHFPTVEQVAGHLNLSVRTFQRKLKNEGYSYKKLIDELRKDFAIDYLANPELSIGDVAYLLSYADTSTFIRSFKRWTGKTPSEFRKT